MSDDPTWEELVAQPDKRFVYEIPLVGRYWLLENAEPPQPETDLQALMEAAPHEPPRTSKEAQTSLNDLVADIVAKELSPEERSVIEITVYAGHSIRTAAKMLGWPKSTVHRLRSSALERIKHIIETTESSGESDE